MSLTARPIFDASGMPLRRFRETVKASTATVRRRLDGPIAVTIADRWCRRIGKHPVEVYGVAVWVAALEADRG